MKIAHLHLPSITPFARVSHIQETLTTRLLSQKKTAALPPSSSASSTFPAPDPTIITFTPNPVYTTGRRDLPPSNTRPESPSLSSSSPTNTLSLPPSLEPIRSLLCPPNININHNRKTKYHNSSDGSAVPVAEYHPTLRGGQTTYHGPGQMVAYTILDLRRLGLTPRCHIRLLENSVVDVLGKFGIKGLLTEDPGVWVCPSSSVSPSTSPSLLPSSSNSNIPKKITAVGVHLRRNISSYGIGFNVTEEPMWYFRQIVPCGLEGREATSLQGMGVPAVTVDLVAGMFVDAFVGRLKDANVGVRGEKIEGVYRVREEDVFGGVKGEEGVIE